MRWLVFLALGLGILLWHARRHTPPALPEFGDVPDTTPARSRLGQCLQAFDHEWNRSFTHGQATRDTIHRLTDLADACQAALSSVRAALPQDEDRHAQLTRVAERIQEDHFAKLEELRQRCGAPLYYPRALDDLHYRRFYKAAVEDDGSAGVPLSSVWPS